MSIEEILLAASEQGIYFYLKDNRLAYKAKKNAVSDEFRQVISDRRNEIRAFLQKSESNASVMAPELVKADQKSKLPLSFAQQRLWFIDQLEGSQQYVSVGQLLVEGELDKTAFSRAFTLLLDRHKVLKTCIRVSDGEPYQHTLDDVELPIEYVDLVGLDESQLVQAIEEKKDQHRITPFDLSADVMLRLVVLSVSKEHHLVVYSIHHIASDGWSNGILRRDLTELYAASIAGRSSTLPELRFQYADYATWQRNWLQGDVLNKELDYWKENLQGIPELHQIPLDKPRPQKQSYKGRGIYSEIDSRTSKLIGTLCEQSGVTRFMFLQTAFAVLLSRYSQQEDIVIGTPIAGRTHSDLEGLIGFFINSLVLRTRVDEQLTFTQLLEINKQTILDGFAHQHIPFEMLVAELRPKRDTAYNALFQILFVVQNNNNELVELPERTGEQEVQEELNIRFDLALHAVELPDKLVVHWSWRDDLFVDQTVIEMSRNYVELLRRIIESVASGHEKSLNELSIVHEQQRSRLLHHWNDTHVEYQENVRLHDLFEQQVRKQGSRTAVIYDDREYTFETLNSDANKLAHFLISEGAEADSVIALSVNRSYLTMVGLLAVLKAGAAYVPLDPGYPKDRLAFMLEDCQAQIVLTQSELIDNLPIDAQNVVCLDEAEDLARINACPNENPTTSTISSNAAYMIYTSGSTGKPKGVVVSHHSVCNFVQCAIELFVSSELDGAVVSSPLAFDATVQSLYVALCAGRYVELIDDDEHALTNLADYLVDDEERLLFKVTPTHLNALAGDHFVKTNPQARHTIVVAGEILNQEILRQWQHLLPASTFINEYGPTEATVGSSTFNINVDLNKSSPDWFSSSSVIPIGRPFANAQYYILDSRLDVMPLGAVGELYIGGHGVARGYLHRPELTACKFLPNPFVATNGSRMYKTGDLARYLVDGNVEFVGRIDDQVKIRGFRVELGEIENTLQGLSDVALAAVGSGKEKSGATRLVAYIQPRSAVEDVNAYKSHLKESLQKTLPDYMIPAAYVVLSELPLTPSGKVDRNALPDPDVTAYAFTEYVAPVTDTENLLVQLWSELLEIPRKSISTAANFFSLGGHSLLVMKMIGRLQEQDVQTEVRTVFQSETLSGLAARIDAQTSQVLPYKAPPNLIPYHCESIDSSMLPLIDLTQAEIDSIAEKVPGGMSNIQDIYPLAPLQEGILFHHLLDPIKDPYVLDKVFHIENRLIADHIIAALQVVVDRHDVLRTAVISDGVSQPVQVVLRKANVKVTSVPLDPSLSNENELPEQFIAQLPVVNIDQAPILQIVVGQQHGGQCYLVMRSHHIVTDHVGNETMWAEVEAVLQGQTQALPPVAHYRDFVAQALHQAGTARSTQYFEQRLSDVDEPVLPFGLMDTHIDGRMQHRAQKTIQGDLATRIREQSRNLRISPASLFHAAWAIVIGRCSSRQKVVFGTVLSGRLQGTSGAERMLGLFINTLPLRLDVANQPAQDFLVEVDHALKELIEFEHSTLTLAQSCSGVPNDLPLFSALLNFRHTANTTDNVSSAENELVQGIEGPDARTNYPFSLAVSDWGEAFNLKCSMLAPVSAERVLGYVQTTMSQLIDAIDQNRSISTITIIPPDESTLFRETWNNTDESYPTDQCVHQLIEQQARRQPTARAVESCEKRLNYRQLDEAANALAHRLRSAGVNVESRVALCVSRSVESMIGMLGILKAGGTYVPMDTEYPLSRLAYMLEDSGATVVVSQAELDVQLTELCDCSIVLNYTSQGLEIDGEVHDQASTAQNLNVPISPRNAAYVIYTSGSTGRPKGVVVEHASIANFLFCADSLFHSDRITGSIVSSPLAFDATVQSLFLPLITGRFVKFLAEDTHLFANLATEITRDDECLLFKITPTHLKALSAEVSSQAVTGARHVVVVAGELLSYADLTPWMEYLPNTTFINEYGPTEATVGTTTFDTRQLDGSASEHDQMRTVSVPIGKPFANARLYVVNAQMEPVPIGVPGELYIAGSGLARSYFNRPIETSSKFIPDPFSRTPGGRLYRTGDLVRYLEDGNIEFISRLDSQVKIRGMRIELGEIEHQLLHQAHIEEAVAVVRADASNDSRIVAYLVGERLSQEKRGEYGSEDTTVSELRTKLRETLPDYMVPTAFVVLDELPLTPNGKLDRNALPIPDIEAFEQAEWREPDTETEVILARLWGELLELPVERISANANFFALGGHSLMIMRLIAKLQSKDLHASVSDVFSSSSLAGLAQTIDNHSDSTSVFRAPTYVLDENNTAITPDMLPLVLLTEDEISRIVEAVPGGVENIQDIYPLAPLQEGILFHHLMSPQHDPYVLGNMMLIEHQKAVEARIEALEKVVARHSTLRTAIVSEGLATPVQVVLRNVDLPVHRFELDANKTIEEQLSTALQSLPVLRLDQAPMLRLIVFSSSRDTEVAGPSYVYQQSHHIISDHIGSAILNAEVDSFTAGLGGELPDAPDYRDFVAHTAQHVSLEEAGDWYTGQLEDIVEPTLPFGLRDVLGDDKALKKDQCVLENTLNVRIRDVARTLHMSPAAVFHAAWALVVGLCSGRDDVVFGTVMSGRLQGVVGAERMIGLLMNTMTMRVKLNRPSPDSLLRDVEQQLNEMIKFEQAPLTLAQSSSGVPNDTPLFSALLNYRHSGGGGTGGRQPKQNSDATLPSSVRRLGADGRSNYPFELSVSDWGDGFSLHMSITGPVEPSRILGYMTNTLDALTREVENEQRTRVSDLSILPEEEYTRQHRDWNATFKPHDSRQTILERLDAFSSEKRDSVALLHYGDVGVPAQISYGELHARSNSVAHALLALDGKPERRVGICMDRGPESVVALLAAMKSGACYVPMDPEYPVQRLKYMLDNSAIDVLMTKQDVAVADVLTGYATDSTGATVYRLNIDDVLRSPIVNVDNPTVSIQTENLAYVIYTSGSTGKPKGVMVSHGSLSNLAHFQHQQYGITGQSRVLQFASFSFDAAVWDWSMALYAGATLHSIDDALVTSVDRLNMACQKLNITYSYLPPAILALLDRRYFTSLNTLTVGGEQPTLDVLQQWAKQCRVYNAYGPTENTVVSTTAEILPTSEQLLIGTPIDNTRCHILNTQAQPVPIGVPGELCLTGEGLSRGYLARAALTAERFVPNDHDDIVGSRLYRSGDIARWVVSHGDSARLEFLGRVDEQVKIRGYRIELGEIDQVVRDHPGILDVHVCVDQIADTSSSIVAFYLASNTDQDVEVLELAVWESLRSHLPDYMIPTLLIHLPEWPTTPAGKMDKAALDDVIRDKLALVDYRAPATPTETLLVEIWGELLQRPPTSISADANFFSLGGHSLLVMKMASVLQTFDIHVDVRSVFEQPVLERLAKQLDESDSVHVPFVAPLNLISHDCERVTPDLLPLVSLASPQIEAVARQVPGGHRNIQDIYPLAPLQEGILFHHLLNPEKDPYIIEKIFVVEQEGLIDDMLNALKKVIQRHDILRTAIISDGVPETVQVVYRQIDLPVIEIAIPPETFEDNSALQKRLWSLKQELAPFELSKAPLVRAIISEDTGVGTPRCFVLQFHHILSDHIGDALLRYELSVILEGRADQLPPPVPYRNFVAHIIHQAKQRDANAWFTDKLADVEEPTLPFGLTDVRGDGHGLDRCHRELDADLSMRVRHVASALGVRSVTLFHAVWALVVSACSGQQTVVFGTVLSGRLQGISGVERMLGLFINTLPVRVDLATHSALELVQNIESYLIDLMDYEQASLVEAQNCSQVPNGVPLFSALLNYRHSHRGNDRDNEANSQRNVVGIAGEERTNFPFALSVSDWSDAFSLDVVNVDVVSAERVTHYVLEALDGLLTALESHPQKNALTLPVLPSCEKALLQRAATGRVVDEPLRCVHHLFERQVRRSPDRIAIIDNQKQLSFSNLNSRANQLARYLIDQGVKAEDRIGVCMVRGADYVTAVLAIVKAGAAFVPLDPTYPRDRLNYQLEDASVGMVLVHAQVRSTVEALKSRLVFLDELHHEIEAYSSLTLEETQIAIHPESLMYLIYTSGSTGRPKGVMGLHRSVSNRMNWWLNNAGAGRDKVLCQKTSIGFVDHVAEVFQALVGGSPLVVLSAECMQEPELVHEALNRYCITQVTLVPSLMKALIDSKEVRSRWLNTVICSGEVLVLDNAHEWNDRFPDVEVMNLYGSTEVGADVTAFSAKAKHMTEGRVSIGQVIDQSTAYILNTRGQLSPLGAVGELYIGGTGLARGYFNQSGLTAERFVPDAYSSEPGSRLYRTGDLARYRFEPESEGLLIDFIGRADQQVKIRGFRIELPEIEYHLSQHETVDSSIVMALPGHGGDLQLTAFVVLNKDTVDINTALTNWLSNTLPGYMLPTIYLPLDSVPLTPSGKVDRLGLAKINPLSNRPREIVAPETETEKSLALAWAELLDYHVDQLSKKDNFFALGGHSLIAIKLVSLLRERNLSCDIRMVMETPTLEHLATSIDSSPAEFDFVVPANKIPDPCSLITPSMLPLVDLSESDIDAIVAQVPGGASAIADIYPLIPLQEGLLFHHLIDRQNDPFVLSGLMSLAAEAQMSNIEMALETLVQRHDALRTLIISEGVTSTVQVVMRRAELTTFSTDLPSGLTRVEIIDRLEALCPPFNLSRDNPFQVAFGLDKSTGITYMLMQTHHIISDNISNLILIREMETILSGRQEVLPEPVPYRNFVAHILEKSSRVDAKQWFSDRLSDVEEPTLPFALLDMRPGEKVVEDRQELSLEVSQRIRELSRRYAMSPASLFHAAWSLVIGLCSGRRDVVFGTVLSGRLQEAAQIDQMVGMFINNLPLRISVADQTAASLLESVDAQLKALLQYEHGSLAMAKNCSGVDRQLPLFTGLLNYRHISRSHRKADAGGDGTDEARRSWEESRNEPEQTNYPFTMIVNDYSTTFSINAITVTQIEPVRVSEYFKLALHHLLDALDTQSNARVEEFNLIPNAEIAALPDYSTTRVALSQRPALHHYFETQAHVNADKIAVISQERVMSYRELNHRANRLAHYLSGRGSVNGAPVGICLDRSTEMIIALLAVLKSGGSYVPLDPSFPTTRLEWMIQDSGLETVLTRPSVLADEELNELFRSTGVAIENLDDDRDLDPAASHNPAYEFCGREIAYVIYTSGSTGKPKGVRVDHRNAINFLTAMSKQPGIATSDRLLAITTLSFDIALLELMLPLTSGATVDIVGQDISSSPLELSKRLQRQAISIMQATPVTWKLLLESDVWPSQPLKGLVGGEALPPSLAHELQIRLSELWNMYGPTETTVWSTISRYEPDQLPIRIGQPIDNTIVHVVNSQFMHVPSGVLGELYIGGAGVAQGYLNRPALTAQRFVPDPFAEHPGERLYRTGDLVRFSPDESETKLGLEYLGRLDQQVKVRGYRIELGEIESVALELSLVKDCAVIAYNDELNGAVLAIYVVVEDRVIENSESTESELANNQSAQEEAAQEEAVVDEIRQYLSAKLPVYMVPNYFICLESLPLTPNGKLDKRALPHPDISHLRRAEYIKPETETQIVIAGIWSELLDAPVESIGQNDSFFNLGGHSLLAIRLTSNVNTRFEITISLPDVFRLNTLLAISAFVDDVRSGKIVSQAKIERLGDEDATDSSDIEEFEL